MTLKQPSALPVFDDLPGAGLVYLHDLVIDHEYPNRVKPLQITPKELRRMIGVGKFPEPIVRDARGEAWNVATVRGWLERQHDAAMEMLSPQSSREEYSTHLEQLRPSASVPVPTIAQAGTETTLCPTPHADHGDLTGGSRDSWVHHDARHPTGPKAPSRSHEAVPKIIFSDQPFDLPSPRTAVVRREACQSAAEQRFGSMAPTPYRGSRSGAAARSRGISA
jgi:hypothetical protein